MSDGGSDSPPLMPPIDEVVARQRIPSTQPPADDDLGGRMSFLQHLEELRRCLLRSLAGTAIASSITILFSKELFRLVLIPVVEQLQATGIDPQKSGLVYISPIEPFVTYLKTGLVAGIFLACPWIFYQLWLFIAPGLYKNERRLALPFVGASAGFFILGGLFCYFLVFPLGIRFFVSLAEGPITPMLSMDSTLSFLLKLLLAFGLVFDLPVLLVLLTRLEIVTPEALKRFRRYFVLVAFIVGAILTPPDVVTQIALAVPLIGLYELSIYAATWFAPKSGEGLDEQASR
ncbi:MAG: twin-arginine translocase subunit TatC [Candidatus Schekmanbacteria bacterium]|nr:twin-arginine translocase subunit TatC [Candidatus Schekmanbacteria bacterium]